MATHIDHKIRVKRNLHVFFAICMFFLHRSHKLSQVLSVEQIANFLGNGKDLHDYVSSDDSDLHVHNFG